MKVDKVHSSRGNRAHLRSRGIKVVIPEKKDQAANRKEEGTGRRPAHRSRPRPLQGREHRRALMNKLRAWRGIATRYDKTPDSYLAGLQLRASMIWIKAPTRRSADHNSIHAL
ncbi:transposase [Streptomyces sp. JCM17656]|nr:transposase [Streptomyces sp. JCM17656]